MSPSTQKLWGTIINTCLMQLSFQDKPDNPAHPPMKENLLQVYGRDKINVKAS
jgi:hypothetical protein